MAEHLITEIQYTDQKRDGSPLLTKQGKQMWSVRLQIEARPGTWIQGVAFTDPKDWKGSKRDLKFHTEQYQGLDVPHFRLAGGKMGAALSNEKLDKIIDLLTSIDAKLGE